MDETAKERLGRWVYSRSLWRSALGTVVKFGIEWAIWAIVLALVAAAVGAVSPEFSLTLELKPNSPITLWAGTTTAVTGGTWCYGATEPEE